MKEYDLLLEEVNNLKNEIELDKKHRGDGAIHDNLGAIYLALEMLSNKLGYNLEEAYKIYKNRER